MTPELTADQIRWLKDFYVSKTGDMLLERLAPPSGDYKASPGLDATLDALRVPDQKEA